MCRHSSVRTLIAKALARIKEQIVAYLKSVNNSGFSLTYSEHKIIHGVNRALNKDIDESDVHQKDGYDFIQQYKAADAIFPDTKGSMRFDFYLPKEKRFIEFDGE